MNRVLHSKADVKVAEQKIEKLQLIDKIKKCRKYGERAFPLVPLLLKVIKNKKSAEFPELIRAIVVLLGYLCPDGLITADLFKHIASGMHCSPDDIIRELEDRGYIINRIVSPAFRPADASFSFTIGHEFDAFKNKIKEILLEASKGMSVTGIIMELLSNNRLAEIQDDIIRALGELGHPIVYPLLLDKAKAGSIIARDVLLGMCFRDIDEFEYLLNEGIKKDLWGNDIKEKVFLSLKQVMPLLFEALESESFPADKKKKLFFLFSEIGVKRSAELNTFVNILPEFMVEKKEECYVTKILIQGGKQAVPYIVRYCKKGCKNPAVLNRCIFILGEIGEEAHESVSFLKEVRVKYPVTSVYVKRALERIVPSASFDDFAESEDSIENNEEAVLDDEDIKADQTASIPADSHDAGYSDGAHMEDNDSFETDKDGHQTTEQEEEVKKQTISADPNDYILY